MRLLLRILASLSFLLCFAFLFLWVRSYSVLDHIYQSHWKSSPIPGEPRGVDASESAWFLLSGEGVIGFEWRHLNAPRTLPPRGLVPGPIWDQKPLSSMIIPVERPSVGSAHQLLGTGYWVSGDVTVFSETITTTRVWTPYWLLAILCAIPPALRVRAYFRHRRRERQQTLNLCPICNYDLRATPDRCPECGHLPQKVGCNATRC